MRPSRPMVASLLVLGVILALFVARHVINRPHETARFVPTVAVRAKGDPSAPVKIVEYTDFQCPACAHANGLVENILKQHEGKIYFEHRHFPLNMHPFARRASVFAECAARQGKFWPLHDVLFKTQQTWAKMPTVDAYFSELAVSLGMDGLALTVCVNNGLAEDQVKKDIASGEALNIRSTPTFLVNGKMAVGGPQLAVAVDEAFGKK